METPDTLPDRWVRSVPLAGDASTRRYSRLLDRDGETAILAQYPPGSGPTVARDMEVLLWLRDRGLRVPAILDSDAAASWVVVEDFGEHDAEAALRRLPGPQRLDHLSRALDPLVTLAAVEPADLPSWNRPLDQTRLRWELAGFELWFIGHARARRPPPDIGRWLDRLAGELAGHPTRVCHRDFHLNNMFFVARGGIGVIDVQDILVGPDTYDAVSLLFERATSSLIDRDQRSRLCREWASRTGAEPGWETRLPRVRLQRSLKVLGTFARLAAAGRSQYGPWMGSIIGDLAADVDELRLPGELVDILID